jgi:hypothetical protein
MRDAAKRATPGPWTREKPPVGDGGFREGCAVAATYGRQTIYANPPGGSFPSFDADHIAASNPASVLALIAAYEAEKERADENFKDAKAYSDAAKMWRDECELERGHVSHLRAQLGAITDQHAAHGWRTADDAAMRVERDALAENLRKAVTKA